MPPGPLGSAAPKRPAGKRAIRSGSTAPPVAVASKIDSSTSVRPFFGSLFPNPVPPSCDVVCGRSVHWLDRIGDAIGGRFAGPDRKPNPWRGRIGSEADAGGSAASGQSRGYIN